MAILTCYKLRPKVEDFDDAVDLEDLPGQVQPFDPISGQGFTAKLYTVAAPPREPEWLAFLKEGFDKATVPPGRSSGALLLMTIQNRGKDHFFAFTFGSGRYLLKQDVFERNYGLKVALNLIFQGGATADPSRLRALDAKRVAETTILTRRQASRTAAFETFDIDVMRDLLSGVTGNPTDPNQWGTRIEGRHSLKLNFDLPFNDLGALCRRVLTAAARNDYKEGFSWIDNIAATKDAETVASLEESLLAALSIERMSGLELVVPEMVEWGKIDRFQFGFDGQKKIKRPELRLQDYLVGLKAKGQLEELDVGRLKRDQVRALDADGNIYKRWSAWRCLSTQIDLGGRTFVLDDGQFFEVAAGYLQELDSYIRSIDESSVDLPDASPIEDEGEYLERVATGSSDFLLLHNKKVKVAATTSQIEVCDLLGPGSLIHVKKGVGAREVSHLLSQGLVSADLLLMNTDFRNKAVEKINEARSAKSENGKGYDVPDADALARRECEVVYAIVTHWNSKALPERLPFFSKVNLRRCADDLKRMGYRIKYKRVAVVT